MSSRSQQKCTSASVGFDGVCLKTHGCVYGIERVGCGPHVSRIMLYDPFPVIFL